MNLELNGTNVIAEAERSGKASSLFWPWCGANVSLLALSYGAFFLGFGISFWQATWAALIGTILSFSLVGFSSLAGKRSNAPTMVLSRAVFGMKGNLVPSFLSYLVFVGWETVLVSLATLATGTIFVRLGGIDQNLAMVFGFILAAALTMYGGILGHSVIMRLQKYLTIITVVATVVYVALTVDSVNWERVSSIPNGTLQGFIGALIFGITGIGLGWVNTAADYSRYLPRTTSGSAVVGWTIFGASIVPICLVIFGVLLAGSDQKLADAIASDPIGALTTLLPTWYLALFALIAILGLVGGAILDLYSSGLTLISTGLPIKRYVAATFDGLIMLAGTIYIVWIADNFFYPFQGFLITLGVPIATWSAIFITDILLRRNPFVEADLFSISGRYGVWNWRPLLIMAIGTFIGWGFVTNTFASWLSWQGYLLFLIGGREGPWAFANVGVIFALVLGFCGHILISGRRIRSQDNALS
jgi:nucleobase:cation symporter-1, NCS1 family